LRAFLCDGVLILILVLDAYIEISSVLQRGAALDGGHCALMVDGRALSAGFW
jgi:hypothetical protein